jgi:stress-induced-phosphoprotein 1
MCACPTQDISFLTNRAAVFFEQGKLDECITDCDSAVTKAYEVHADFKARMHIA